MRSIIPVALTCLAMGALGAFGYSHYLGEGKQLSELQDELSTANTSLATATQESRQAKKETDVMSAQIQQLISTKDNLTHQLDALKGASAGVPAPSASNPMPMDMMKAAMAQQHQTRLLLLKSRLHLTPEQEAAVTAAMDEEEKRGEEMMSRLGSGGKIDPQAMAGGAKSVDQTLNDILTPDQKSAYQQMQADQKNSTAETVASVELNQISPLLQLNDSQKDQVYSALAQAQLNMQDPAWIKANTSNASDPTAILDAQAKAKEDALSKILTPDQMAIYQQQAQSQLDMQKAMMQKFMPAAPGASGAAPAPVINSAP